MIPQLPLSLGFHPKYQLSDFVFGPNQGLAEVLLSSLSNSNQPLIYISGNPGSGRSHLLIGHCSLAQEQNLQAVYIPLKQKDDFAPEMFEGLESFDLVALDDLHLIAGDKAWEEAIFHLFNRLRDQGKRLVISADTGPLSLPVALPDLATRLQWGLAWHLQELEDEQQEQRLMSLAGRQGITLPSDAARYLLQRYDRDIPSLQKHLKQLDHMSLAAKRKITIPFIRETLSG